MDGDRGANTRMWWCSKEADEQTGQDGLSGREALPGCTQFSGVQSDLS